MKTVINNTQGVVSFIEGNGFEIEGKEYHEAAFDQRWDDLYAYIDQGTGPAQLTYEAYRNTGFYMRFFRHNQDDAIFMTYQLPHMWDVGTAVYPHMHYIAMASGSGNVVFDYAYSWVNVHSVLPAANGWISGSVSASLNPSHQYQQSALTFGEMLPDGNHESSIIVFKVERRGSTNASDTYSASKDHGTAAANVGVLFFDLHYQKIKAGTVTQFPEGP